MQKKDPVWTWMSAAFAMAAIIVAGVLAVYGTKPRAIDLALLITARWSFLLFWLAYAGGGLAVLFGPVAQLIARHGRKFGLSFAAAHLVHVGLVAWLCLIGAAPGSDLFYFFVPPLLVLYVIALFSIPMLHKKLSRAALGDPAHRRHDLHRLRLRRRLSGRSVQAGSQAHHLLRALRPDDRHRAGAASAVAGVAALA
jgi:hypothetical protein